MKRRYFAYLVQQLLFAVAVLGIASAASIAQTMQPCKGETPGTCVEILLRYHEQVQKQPYWESKVELLDPKTGQRLKSCQICDPKLDKNCNMPCPNLKGATMHDASNLILLQTHKSPGCYYMCSGGWCGERCF